MEATMAKPKNTPKPTPKPAPDPALSRQANINHALLTGMAAKGQPPKKK